jgi:c-di-GMP-binding flagellar brake protein YcgR
MEPNGKGEKRRKMKREETEPSSGVFNFEKRRHPRFLLNLPIEYSQGESDVTHAGYTFNASEGGLMANLPEQVDIGQHLRLKLFLSLGPYINAIETLSQVVWRDNLEKDGGYGSGVRFVGISPENKNKLENFLNKLSN